MIIFNPFFIIIKFFRWIQCHYNPFELVAFSPVGQRVELNFVFERGHFSTETDRDSFTRSQCFEAARLWGCFPKKCLVNICTTTSHKSLPQPAWPDRAIFETSGRPKIHKSSPNDWQFFGLVWITSLLCKYYCIYFFGNCKENLGYFLLRHLVTLASAFNRTKATF